MSRPTKAQKAITDPIKGAPSTMNAPEFLRWWATRLIRVYGENPRAAHMRAFHELANRLEDAIPAEKETADVESANG